jgi:diaminopimelate decarboxylase
MNDNKRKFETEGIDTLINTSDKGTTISGKPLDWWIDNFSLPLHIFYAPQMKNNLKAFKKVFSDNYTNGLVCFAAKVCTHPEIFKLIVDENSGADIASENETICALKSGVNPANLMLNGNSKEDSLINLAIEKNITIVADSIEEYAVISQIATRLQKKAKAIIRLSGFDVGNVTAASIFTAGNWTKFGVRINSIPEFIKSLDLYPHVDLLGFHVHIGSQITALQPYLVVLGKMIEFGHLLRQRGKECKIINLGGGYPVSYISEEEWDNLLYKIREGYHLALKGDTSKIAVWNNGLAGYTFGMDGKIDFKNWVGEKFFTSYPKEKMLESIFKGDLNINGKSINSLKALKELGEPKIVIEPGRSLVEDSAFTLTKVAHVRSVAVYHYLTSLEMGITNFGQAMLDIPINRWMVLNDYQKKDNIPFETFVAGNLCFSGDMITKYKISLQRKPKRGDILMIQDTGAYDANFFASNANSFPRPSRILLDEEGNISIIKKRDTYAEIFS